MQVGARMELESMLRLIVSFGSKNNEFGHVPAGEVKRYLKFQHNVLSSPSFWGPRLFTDNSCAERVEGLPTRREFLQFGNV